MKPWLQGEFGDVDPKTQMVAMRDFIQTAAHRGLDLHQFWLGLAHLDPLACAELAVGPKAVAHPVAVESALVIAASLEKVIAPSGLYSRMLQLAPSCGPQVAELVAGRFPNEPWIWRLDATPSKGSRILKVHADTPYFEQSCRRALRAGYVDALSVWVRTEHMSTVLRAAMDAKGEETVIQLARMALTKTSVQEVLAVLAALLGPGMDKAMLGLMPSLQDLFDLAELRAIVTGFPLSENWVRERLV